MISVPVFKLCSYCGHEWQSRADFLSDPSLFVIGYQADIESIELGLIMFNHKSERCGTTLAIPVGTFFDLYRGPRYAENLSITVACPRYCIDKHEFGHCTVHCECATAREALAVVGTHLENARRRAASYACNI